VGILAGGVEPGVDLQYLLIFEREFHDLLHEVVDLGVVHLAAADLGLHEGDDFVPSLDFLLLQAGDGNAVRILELGTASQIVFQSCLALSVLLEIGDGSMGLGRFLIEF
jgi:hypothetical protein